MYALTQLIRVVWHLRPQPAIVGHTILIPGVLWNHRLECGQVLRIRQEQGDRLVIETAFRHFSIDGNCFFTGKEQDAFLQRLEQLQLLPKPPVA